MTELMSRLLGCSRPADALEGRAPSSKAKDVAPQFSAISALSDRCEACGISRELVSTVLKRFAKAAWISRERAVSVHYRYIAA
jgi:hypothetical protein